MQESNDSCSMLRASNLAKSAWTILWAVVILAVANGDVLLGSDMFGGGIWFAVIGARSISLLISEGFLGCSRLNPVRMACLALERVYRTTTDKKSASVLGWGYAQQPLARSIKYTSTWMPWLLLLTKLFIPTLSHIRAA